MKTGHAAHIGPMNKRKLSTLLALSVAAATVAGILAAGAQGGPAQGGHSAASAPQLRHELAATVLAASPPQGDGGIHPREAGAIAGILSPATDPACAEDAVDDYLGRVTEVGSNAEMLRGMVSLLGGDLADRFSGVALDANAEALSVLRSQVVALHAEPYRQLVSLGEENGMHQQAGRLEQELLFCTLS